jgi:hypothetical protein
VLFAPTISYVLNVPAPKEQFLVVVSRTGGWDVQWKRGELKNRCMEHTVVSDVAIWIFVFHWTWTVLLNAFAETKTPLNHT